MFGMIAPVCAAEELPQGRVYRALDDSPYQVDFNREINFNRITLRFDEDDFYWGDGDEDYDTFALLWDEGEFDAAVERGEIEFTMTGEYGLSEWSSPELVELWDAGLVTMPEPPKLLVHIRPRDYVTVYSIPDEEIVWNVHRSTTFEEATRYQDTAALRPAEGANPYWDPVEEDFAVTWNQQEYEAGIESGAETFTVSGVYGEPDGDSMKGWARAEGSAEARVVVKQTPAQPLVYHDPLADKFGGMTCAAYVTPDTQFDELYLPVEETLLLVEETYNDTRHFAVVWSREEFEAGMASGVDMFTVSGRYAPYIRWPVEEQQWWADGLIQVDMPAPEVTVHVVRDEKFTFAADVRINYYGDLGPWFAFTWVAGMEEVTLAYSMDNKIWHEEVWAWEDLPSDQRKSGQVELAMFAMDDDYNPMITQDTTVVYVKMTVTGSALAGTTGVYDLKPSTDGWDMTPHDDNGGDHGGGGQGEHDRPGKEDPDDQPEPPTPDPEPEPEAPSHSGDASEPEPIWPLPVWPEWPSALEVIPTPIPVPTPEPATVVPAPSPQEEQPVLADIPIREEPGAPPPAGGGRISTSADDAQTAMMPEAPPKTAPSPSEAVAAETTPAVAPESQTPHPTPEPASEPPASTVSKAVPQAPTAHIPGFIVAAVATAAVVLGGAAWFHWRGKRK